MHRIRNRTLQALACRFSTTSFLLSHLINSITGVVIGSIGAIGLMIYLQDSKVAGRAIPGMAAPVISNTLRFFPRWAGWVYAISMVGFVLSHFLLDIGQSIASVLWFIATVFVAWNARK